jgi:hypothetical protein
LNEHRARLSCRSCSQWRPLETFDNRQNAKVHRRGIWSEKQIDTIRIDEPLVGLGGLVPLRLIVIDDELYPFASLAGDFQTTTRVHLFAPQGVSLRLHGRRRGERSGLPDRITDADDVALAGEVETSAVDTVSPATNSLRFIMALLRRRRLSHNPLYQETTIFPIKRANGHICHGVFIRK